MCGLLSDKDKFSLGISDLSCAVEVPALGLSGGSISFWGPVILNIDSISNFKYWICINGALISSGVRSTIINIYAPLLPSLK